jgi:predicted DsbA family dithiol-disulfide isomerase
MTERVGAFFAERGLPAYAPPSDIVSNSRTALRLGELARALGLHGAFHDRVMDAYWAEGRDIGDVNVLRRVSAEVGLCEDDVEAVIPSERYLDVVRTSTENAISIGVTGVPGFLLDQRLLVLGAQPNEVFEQAFGQLA